MPPKDAKKRRNNAQCTCGYVAIFGAHRVSRCTFQKVIKGVSDPIGTTLAAQQKLQELREARRKLKDAKQAKKEGEGVLLVKPVEAEAVDESAVVTPVPAIENLSHEELMKALERENEVPGLGNENDNDVNGDEDDEDDEYESGDEEDGDDDDQTAMSDLTSDPTVFLAVEQLAAELTEALPVLAPV